MPSFSQTKGFKEIGDKTINQYAESGFTKMLGGTKEQTEKKEIERLKGESSKEKTLLLAKIKELSISLQNQPVVPVLSNDEVDRLKTELQNTTRFIHDAKENNAKLARENAQL